MPSLSSLRVWLASYCYHKCLTLIQLVFTREYSKSQHFRLKNKSIWTVLVRSQSLQIRIDSQKGLIEKRIYAVVKLSSK